MKQLYLVRRVTHDIGDYYVKASNETEAVAMVAQYIDEPRGHKTGNQFEISEQDYEEEKLDESDVITSDNVNVTNLPQISTVTDNYKYYTVA